MQRVEKLEDLNLGDSFRRPEGKSRYVVSPSRDVLNGNISIYCYNLDGDSDGYWMRGCMPVVRLPLPSKEERPSAPESFCMCYAEGYNAPAVRHTNKEAILEAERLARTTGRKIFLLRAIAYVKYNPPSNSEHQWTTLNEEDC